MNAMQAQQLLTPGEVAKHLNVSTVTLWRWRKSGDGPPFVKLGNKTIRYLPLRVSVREVRE